MGTVWAIVLAGGRGSRIGGLKQFEDLDGRRVLDWSLDAAQATCDGLVLVVPPGVSEPGAVTGGITRSGSVRAGLAVVPDDAEIVLVHDSARPLAPADLWERVVAAVRAGGGAAIPVVAVADTIKRVEGDIVAETLDRGALVAVQTPQGFRAEALREGHAGGADATDDSALVGAIGGKVVTVDDRRNFKLTTPDDLVIARAFVHHSP